MLQIHQLQKRSEGNNDHTEIGDIFQVAEGDDEDEDDSFEGGSHQLGLVNNEISPKTNETTNSEDKSKGSDTQGGQEITNCVEAREDVMGEGQNEGDVEKTSSLSGKMSIQIYGYLEAFYSTDKWPISKYVL